MKNIKKQNIKKLWDSISDFESRERSNESKNAINSEARASARMEAYVKLMEKEIDD